MSMLPVGNPDYDAFRASDDPDVVTREVRTKQAFKDSADINKILQKAQTAGGLSHALKYDKAVYGEFTGVDLLGAYQQLERAQQIFDDLPSEVRKEFDHSAIKFAGYASDPANIDRLAELLPAIAKPGAYFPNPAKRGAPTGHSPAGSEPSEPTSTSGEGSPPPSSSEAAESGSGDPGADGGASSTVT